MGGKSLIALLVAGVLFVLGNFSLFQVHETEQALVLAFGEPKRTITDPGLHFKNPLYSVVILERRILNLDVPPEEVVAFDQKRLVVDAFARFRVTDPLKVYQRVRDERGASNRLSTIVRSQLKEVLARQTFASMLSPERAGYMQEIQEGANIAASELGVELVDVRIKRVDLPIANSQAIYRRMETERQQEAAEARAKGEEEALRIRSAADRDRTIVLADAERQANILRGEGEGQSVQIFADAFGKDEEFFDFYRSMQAYCSALKEKDTTMVLSPDSEFFKFFDKSRAEN